MSISIQGLFKSIYKELNKAKLVQLKMKDELREGLNEQSLTFKIKERSALPSPSGGVGSARKRIVDLLTASVKSVVKLKRPCSTLHSFHSKNVYSKYLLSYHFLLNLNKISVFCAYTMLLVKQILNNQNRMLQLY